MLKKILAIAGKPGLFRLVSKGKRTLVVETLDEARRRMPAFATERIISLGDVAMYTDQEEVPLREVLKTILEQQEGKPVAIDLKQASRDDLAAFMAKALPTYDRERVHTSDIRKLVQWYNILVQNQITDFDGAATQSTMSE